MLLRNFATNKHILLFNKNLICKLCDSKPNMSISRNLIKRFIRKVYTNSELTMDSLPVNTIKSFDEIPGPKGFLGLGSILNYLPFIGSYKWTELHKAGFKKYEQYGDIVRERMIPGVDVVWLFNPDDIKKVLNEYGPECFPSRKSHLALAKYRNDRYYIYKTAGLLPTNGPDWYLLRKQAQKGLSSIENVRQYLPVVDEIVREFIDTIQPTVPDFQPELARLFLEIIMLVSFDERMNSFSMDEHRKDSRSSRIIDAAETSNNSIIPTDQGLQLWRYFETPSYRRLRKSQEYLQSTAIEIITKQSKREDEPARKSILNDYIQNYMLSLSDIVNMSTDILLAGVDTTTYTTSFILYHLATNQDVQEKLFNEVREILPDPNVPLSSGNITAPYTFAVLKESLRLNPISVGVGRNLSKDEILSGYLVPKGTVTVTQNFIISRLPKYFRDPEKFIPERWIRGDELNESVHPFAVLPFGHGSRACIARRLAEQNIMLFMIRLIRKYRISWNGNTEMNIKTELINKPDIPLRITFSLRGN